MEFDFGFVTIMLPPLHITLIIILMIFLLVRWSKNLETRRITVFYYFLISIIIYPIFSYGTREGMFQLWVPLGFIVVFLYMLLYKKYHPSKMKASLLGLCIAIYLMVLEYVG
ncbi:hypothetical protein H8S33_15270 [Ornithinibacillus sp. BX22]|uniref:Uncharacterized protein n=2 Tax=Ornithinibacillus TaxID=484508 RepID=A0A923L871_9BACI|nr:MULTISPECIES: hypothetical protein [Ornithinibacillus]MBC5638155.1 hypothetical protein [Ornithinibacillus hominis]MBS3680773.1 hypothetical protein [Ornithinibacillus massiliensis]